MNTVSDLDKLFTQSYIKNYFEENDDKNISKNKTIKKKTKKIKSIKKDRIIIGNSILM
tara:strand:+ start:479 stop:652 length:174 start_codon:yes stop_codon:yes gene_type:complete